MTDTAKATPLEEKMIRAIAESDFNNGDPTEQTWLDTTIEDSGLDPQVAGGVITSLQKKGLAQVLQAGRFSKDGSIVRDGVDMTDAGIILTEAGVTMYRHLLEGDTHEQRAEEERITRALNDAVEQMKKDADNIRTQLHKDPANLLYVLEWARGHAENAQYGVLAREVLHELEDGEATLRDALKQQVARCQRALLNDHMTASSTSPFSNATDHARRAAMSRFYRTFADEL